MANSEKPVIHDLFPIGEEAAFSALALFDPEVEEEKQNQLMASGLRKFGIRNQVLMQSLILNVSQEVQVMEPSVRPDQMEAFNRYKQSIIPSYLVGLAVGYDALHREACARQGKLPEIDPTVIETWEGRAGVQSAIEFKMLMDMLGNVTCSPEQLARLDRLLDMNRFGSARTTTFFNKEKALRVAFDRYLPRGTAQAVGTTIYTPNVASAVVDVVEVFKLHHQKEVTKAN